MTTFGNRLRQARNRKHLTQNQVAGMLGIDFTTISKYENNRSQPDHDLLKELANVYEVSVDWLLSGEAAGAGHGSPNRIIVGEVQEELTDEEGRYLLDTLEMYRLLQAKRAREKREKEKRETENRGGGGKPAP